MAHYSVLDAIVQLRDYDWTAVALDTAALPEGWGHWLLARRQVQLAEGKTVRSRPGGRPRAWPPTPRPVAGPDRVVQRAGPGRRAPPPPVLAHGHHGPRGIQGDGL